MTDKPLFASQAERMAVAEAYWHGESAFTRIALTGGLERPETPPHLNWDSLQALHRGNPALRIVRPDPQGQFFEQSWPEFLEYVMEQNR